MKKKFAALTLAMVMCFAVTACGDKESTAATETTAATEESIVEEATIAVEESAAETTEEAAETTEETTETASDEAAETTEAATEEADAESEAAIKAEIPEGFTEASEGMYLNPDYPNDGSNIIIMSTPGDAGEIPTEEAFKEQLVAALGDTEMEVMVEDYEQYTVSGYDAVRMTIKYTIEEVDLSQTYVMVFGDGVIGSAIYTAQGDAWIDAFDASIESITME